MRLKNGWKKEDDDVNDVYIEGYMFILLIQADKRVLLDLSYVLAEGQKDRHAVSVYMVNLNGWRRCIWSLLLLGKGADIQSNRKQSDRKVVRLSSALAEGQRDSQAERQTCSEIERPSGR